MDGLEIAWAILSLAIPIGFLLFICAMFMRLVRAAEGAREALRDLAERFPRMGN